MISRLGVFLGSSDGSDPTLAEAAYEVGRELAGRGIELVYGGGATGLMGRVSDGVLDHGGRVYGVIPRFMVEREWGRLHQERVTLRVVENMHQRKALMTERAQAFLTLPGGLGTLEELFEVWTWHTLGLHSKPIGLLDVGGFWRPLVATLDRLAETGFMARRTVDDLVVSPDLEGALAGLMERIEGRATDG